MAALDDADLIERFIRSILTATEVRLVSSRWELVKMLKAGKSQRTIARELGLSLCKITRGSRELKGESSALRRTIELFENLPKES
jgi:TrpR family trp operon transcriptional repressor